MKKFPSLLPTALLFATWFSGPSGSASEPIDLATALRLAGAQNLDVALAVEKAAEARANHQSSLMAFFPWLSPAVAYRGHEGPAQNTDGRILDADKDLVTYGPALTAQVDLGEAIYRRHASRQLVVAAGAEADAQRQDAVMLAAVSYFDLVHAQAVEHVAADAVAMSRDFVAQLENAVEAGVALKGDALRAEVQVNKANLTKKQAQLASRLAGTRLATQLRIGSSVNLVARDSDIAPLDHFPDRNHSLPELIDLARSRPEIARSEALAAAEEARRDGAKFGPLFPTIGGVAAVGGLSGGPDGERDEHGRTADYGIGLSWRIGPGGLFDKSRVKAAESRLRQAEIQKEKTGDIVEEQVSASHASVVSLREQIAITEESLAAARQALGLAEQRTEFGIAAVLDRITAQEDLIEARLAHAATLAEFNKAQYVLLRAIGAIRVTAEK